MINRWAIRILISLGCAGLFALLSVLLGNTKSLAAQTPLPDDCNECHESVVIGWQDSQHGQALHDPVFQEAWQEKGSPTECLNCHTTGYDAESQTWQEDGVACEACHAQPEGSTHHPEQVMSTDRSAEACGQCHVDTYESWQLSKHGDEDLACVRCHNPHTTSLKSESVQEVCIACHNETAYFFTFTSHAQEGLLCTDCHLQMSDTPLGDGHSKREHTFAVDLTTCNDCHDQEMHAPPQKAMQANLMSGTGIQLQSDTAVTPCEGQEIVQAARDHIVYADTAATPVPSAAEPAPFTAVIPTTLGLLLGIMISPIIERFYRRTRIWHSRENK
jgi:predicted CXXCH cytochrome family protein